jgi:phosphoglycerate kinase
MATAFKKKTIEDVDVSGKRVLVRVDFNVPIENGQISDDTRIRAALPTIEYLLQNGAAVILCSHLGRPKGKDEKFSLRPVADHLGGLLGKPVVFAEDCIGPQAEQAAKALKPGDVLLLENTRFHAEEEKNDPEMARQLASLADLYVDDAFGSAHRAHASTEGVTHYLPAVAGFLMEKEIRYLGQLLEEPARPFVAILGGAKVSDKIGVIRNLLQKADRVLIGGGMANTFFKAQGYEIGNSLVEDGVLETAKQLIAEGGDHLRLPTDAVIADAMTAEAARKLVAVNAVPAGWRILDIGPQTVAAYSAEISGAKTVFWNGPMGVFELEPFAEGTYAIAKAVAQSQAVSVVGGGDSVSAVQRSGFAGSITHISTGGGASLEMVEGRELPGVVALQDK